jgi:putative nucleotidyltransferase with HDIG domain
MSSHPAQLDAATERRIAEQLERRQHRLNRRELLGTLLFTVGFVVAAAALALLAEPERAFSLPLALAFLAAYVVADRIEFSIGAGYAVPSQLVLVPMLLLLPTPLVPLLVAFGIVVPAAVEAARGGTAAGRSVMAVSDAWFAVAPAAVLVFAGAQTPELAHWPAYVAALAAQVGANTAVFFARARLGEMAMPLRDLAREMAQAVRVDLLLAPIGLLAALAAAQAPAAALLVLALIPLLRGFEREREGRIQHSLELGRAYRGTALLLRDLLEEDDEYTGHHTEDVVELAVKVAEEMGLDEDVRRETEMGALLHDIGKIAVPDEIINKPGPLNDEEWAIMKTHTVEGERMLQQVGGLLSSVGRVVRASHERWDGGGYPDGLAGEEIPVAARICAASDAFNAMTTDRSYRKALPLEVAIAELHANSGTQFAPDVVEALIAVVARDTSEWELAIAAPAAAQPAGGSRSMTVSSAA